MIYVTPDKVYVVRDGSGNPTLVVQNRKMADFFARVDGGDHVLVTWYNKEKFDKEFGEPTDVTYQQYVPSFINPGDYVYRPLKQFRGFK